MINSTDDLEALIDVIPPDIASSIRNRTNNNELLEVVLDLGRLPEARYSTNDEVKLSDREIGQEDLNYISARVSEFTTDNRAGIERTLHRISAIRNRRGNIIGITCRIGRAVYGTLSIIEDLVRSNNSILLLGRPGVGKTTMLREIARYMADEINKRVVIVDTSNEIAGDGDIPHSGIGSARRMQVPTPSLQHQVMIEAVENHMPEVIIVDEIGTEEEAIASRTIAERGVQLIATAHGNTLENLMMNPTLSDLVGGIQSVTLSDEEARRRGTKKSILERQAPPTFESLVEIQSFNSASIRLDVKKTVDTILRGQEELPELRQLDSMGKVDIRKHKKANHASQEEYETGMSSNNNITDPPQSMYPFGISKNKLQKAIVESHSKISIANNLEDSHFVLTIRNHYRRKPQLLRDAEEKNIPIYVAKNNTISQLSQFLISMSPKKLTSPISNAIYEAETAISQVIKNEEPQELNPQNSYIRKLQHMLAQRYNLDSQSMGNEPQRRVRIIPSDME